MKFIQSYLFLSMSHVKQKKRFRLPAWCLGAFVGQLFWGVVLCVFIFEIYEIFLPQWFLRGHLADLLATICMVIAVPVGVGGWLFIWGDNGPPYPWLSSLVFNVVFALFFYGFLGALLAVFIRKIGRSRKRWGHCMNCGYDLRGSPGRCPECGAQPSNQRLQSTGDAREQ